MNDRACADETYTGDVRLERRSHTEAATLNELVRWAEFVTPDATTSSHQFFDRLAKYVEEGSSSRPHTDEPIWRQYIRRRLTDMAGHPRTPGYPRGDTLASAVHWADHLVPLRSPTPSVVPGDEGEVELVWHRNGWDLELTVAPRSVSVWAYNPETGEEISGELDDEHRDLVRDLLSGWAANIER